MLKKKKKKKRPALGWLNALEKCNLFDLLFTIDSGPDSIKLDVNSYKIGKLQVIFFLSSKIANEFYPVEMIVPQVTAFLLYRVLTRFVSNCAVFFQYSFFYWLDMLWSFKLFLNQFMTNEFLRKSLTCIHHILYDLFLNIFLIILLYQKLSHTEYLPGQLHALRPLLMPFTPAKTPYFDPTSFTLLFILRSSSHRASLYEVSPDLLI